jgi:DNA-binding NtrC family response regulator
MMNSPQAAENPSTLHVLVVDDEPLIRWSLRHGLVRRGHQVTEAGDAAQALNILSRDPDRFDAVILDYRLPDRQDLSLLTEVRQLAPHATVWMMTAFGDGEMRAEALALGARGVIDKPFQVTTVVSIVESGRPPDANPHV